MKLDEIIILVETFSGKTGLETTLAACNIAQIMNDAVNYGMDFVQHDIDRLSEQYEDAFHRVKPLLGITTVTLN